MDRTPFLLDWDERFLYPNGGLENNGRWIESVLGLSGTVLNHTLVLTGEPTPYPTADTPDFDMTGPWVWEMTFNRGAGGGGPCLGQNLRGWGLGELDGVGPTWKMFLASCDGVHTLYVDSEIPSTVGVSVTMRIEHKNGELYCYFNNVLKGIILAGDTSTANAETTSVFEADCPRLIVERMHWTGNPVA